MKIQIKHRFNSSILFEHECENNTIKETLIQGIKTGANLENANLENANLRNAYLQNANLENAYLQNANLENAYLQNDELPIFAKWAFSIKNNQIIKIGCKEKTICEWDLWFASKEEFATKRGTPEFKQIEAVYLAHKAYLTHLNL